MVQVTLRVPRWLINHDLKVDHDLFYDKVKFGYLGFAMNISERFYSDLKVCRYII